MKTLIVVGVISILIGMAISVRLDFTQSTEAQSFWKEDGREPLSMQPASFANLARDLAPAVVNISTTQVVKGRPVVPFPEFRGPFEDFFGEEFKDFFGMPDRKYKRQSLGSGFVINKEGYILTNNHVVENAEEILVTLAEGKKEYEAELIGRDAKLDIALIKIDAKHDLPIVVLGDSDKLSIGEWVVAIGNPFGLGGTVTAGIVSAKGRAIGAGPYDNFIQTDASIHPGNSGGPLFNMSGEVVGINTAIIAGGQGIGFASPINMVKDVLLQLKEKGKVTRGWIGVSIQKVTPELADSFKLKDTKGALIAAVKEGDPADKAGIKAGDIIVGFDGKDIDEMNDLPRIVAATPPGKTVKVDIIRDGKEKTLSLTVSAREEGTESAWEGREGSVERELGLSVQPITPEIASRLGLRGTEGVLISSVAYGSPGAMAGLRRGDVIKSINRKAIKDIDGYREAMSKVGKGDIVRMLIQRGHSTFFVALKLKK